MKSCFFFLLFFPFSVASGGVYFVPAFDGLQVSDDVVFERSRIFYNSHYHVEENVRRFLGDVR